MLTLCDALLQDVPWLLWVPVDIGPDQVARQPIDDLCAKCGLAIKSFPLSTKDSSGTDALVQAPVAQPGPHEFVCVAG
jgi:hypothetical protein